MDRRLDMEGPQKKKKRQSYWDDGFILSLNNKIMVVLFNPKIYLALRCSIMGNR